MEVTVGAVLVFALTIGVAAQSQDASLYKEALTREAALREDLVALAADQPPEPLYERIRVMVGAYEDIARFFPESDYGDNALWQGGVLAADLFERTADAQDRETAMRLLEALVERFPASSLTPKVSARIALLRSVPVGAARVTPPPAAPPSPPPAALPRASVAAGDAAAPRPELPARPSEGAAPETPPAVPAPAPPPPRPLTTRPAAVASSPAVLRSIRNELLPEVVRITLNLEREVSFTDERLLNPPRVFVDLENVAPARTVQNATIALGDPIVKRLRVVGQPRGGTRVAVDLVATADYSIYALYNPFRLVIDFERSRTRSGSAATRATASAGRHANTADAAMAANAAAPRPPAANAAGGFSLSRQLGLAAARIVIDPGHGGHDPGAEAASMTEAGLVLDVALRLERLLKEGNHAEAVLTRRGDTYVSLEDRTAIAHRSRADLFLSIHANANSAPGVRGVETYVLNFAATPEAEALAARENAASSRSMRDLPDLVRAIADDNKIDESRDFARIVQRTLYERLRTVNTGLKNLGVKQAPFMVLVGARMPAVLVEIAFMTNRQEAALLRTTKYRQQIAEALLAGITRYQDTLKKALAGR